MSEYSYLRNKNWRGSFGQLGAAQIVLTNASIEKGDLFLFFSWFNKTHVVNNQLKYNRGEGFHMIYGWLEVFEKIYTSLSKVLSWFSNHPHMNINKKTDLRNCIYVGSKALSWNKEIKGYGVFLRFSEDLVLTKKGVTRSK